jgi:hypothetical protein
MINKYIFQKLFTHFTAGQTINSIKNKIQELQSQNLYPIIDYIKESSSNNQSINQTILEYIKLSELEQIDYIALKLSSLNFNEQKIDYLINILINKDKKIMIDAEEDSNHNIINDITDKLIYKYNKKDINIYKTYQMYRKDGYNTLNYDIHNINNLGIKLVRGAYYNQDYNSGKLFTNKKETDYAFENAMKLIFNNNSLHAFICTHNYYNINQMITYIRNNKNDSAKIAHASLYGFIKNDTKEIVKSGITTYKYLPYGNFDDSIPYLTRRIYENPKILFYMLK